MWIHIFYILDIYTYMQYKFFLNVERIAVNWLGLCPTAGKVLYIFFLLIRNYPLEVNQRLKEKGISSSKRQRCTLEHFSLHSCANSSVNRAAIVILSHDTSNVHLVITLVNQMSEHARL